MDNDTFLTDSTASENIPKEIVVKKNVFFTRKSIDYTKKKKPILYQIYLCYRIEPIEDPSSDDSMDLGVWCALIIKQPQNVYMVDKNAQTTYMLNGSEKLNSNIRIRLIGLKEVLNWITFNLPEESYTSIDINFVCNDVFIVNLLREWLPKWHKNGFRIGKDDNRQRPNLDLLTEISNISTKINMTIKWQVEKSYEMVILSEKIDLIIRKLRNTI
jgi:hypothetical protein